MCKIETIWKKRKKEKKRVQYLVKWLGYPNTFNSWIFRPDLQKHSTHTWIVSFMNWHRPTQTVYRLGSLVEKKHLDQVLMMYTVIGVSIYNLTIQSQNSTLWTPLLSSCLGYMLPNLLHPVTWLTSLPVMYAQSQLPVLWRHFRLCAVHFYYTSKRKKRGKTLSSGHAQHLLRVRYFRSYNVTSGDVTSSHTCAELTSGHHPNAPPEILIELSPILLICTHQ